MSRRAGRRRGWSLVELQVAVIIGGVLAAMAVPSFRRSVEQARVDQASAALRSIWAAQRFYRLDHPAFAPDLAALQLSGLIDELNRPESSFTYRADADGSASAERKPGSSWAGTLTVDPQGVLGGSVTDGSATLAPPALLLGG